MNNEFRILIVEDDKNISRYISACLDMGGYAGTVCDNGADAVEIVLNGGIDLVLLDVMLPGLDGFSVMERIRPAQIPVIFLTAKQDISDKVNGLRLGAEDYIVKPFEALELLARIEVALRRINKDAGSLKYGDMEIDIDKHYAAHKGEAVPLTPKEFDVLVYLIKHQDIVISRERLLSAIWGYEFTGETRTVDTHVQQVRKKAQLRDKLVTVPKYGYKLIKAEDK